MSIVICPQKACPNTIMLAADPIKVLQNIFLLKLGLGSCLCTKCHIIQDL